MENQTFKKEFYLIFYGDPNVGKTNLISRFCGNGIITDYKPTKGMESHSNFFSEKNKNYKLTFYDIGKHRYSSIIYSYSRKCSAYIMVFDITNYKSFLKLEEYNDYHEKKLDNKKARKYIIGTKSDLEEAREVEDEEI